MNETTVTTTNPTNLATTTPPLNVVHKRVHVIVTAEPSNASVNTVASTSTNDETNHVETTTRRMRFEVRPITDDQLTPVTSSLLNSTVNHFDSNGPTSNLVCSVQPGSNEITSTTTSTSAKVTTSIPTVSTSNISTSRVHPPLTTAGPRPFVASSAINSQSSTSVINRQSSARFSPKASPTSLHSLHSSYGSSTALLTTTNSTCPANHLRGGETPSRNPSVKSTGYTDLGSAGASARIRSLRRRISHTLLYVPEQRRVSTTSGVSVTSCPTEFVEDDDQTSVKVVNTAANSAPQSSKNRRYTPAANAVKDASARVPLIQPSTQDTQSLCANHPAVSAVSSNASSVSSRRQSIQTGAPFIGFPVKRRNQFGRRSSQPEFNVAARLAALQVAANSNTSGGRSNGGNANNHHHTAPAIAASCLTPETTLTTLSEATHGPGNVAIGPVGGMSLNKRVSWLSMKSLQDPMDELAEFRQRVYGGGRDGTGAPRSDSRTNSQLDIGVNDTFDIESDTPPIDTMSWSNLDEFEASCTLMYSKHEKIPMKDFGSEIRATMDIDHLLNKAVLLLDLQETSLEEIFAKIIHEMDIQEPEFTSEQVRSVLFTQDAGNQYHILSRTVQSICTTGTVGGSRFTQHNPFNPSITGFDYDQSWICALCMLNTVQHRHVAIARLSHPTNLGRTMQDLRFIIIVIAPSRAKGTKTALETTRTFATLFADMDIRQKLVMAQSVEVFRATLLDAAKELAFEQSQWRERKASIHLSEAKEQVFGPGPWHPLRGLLTDFKKRKRHYIADYLDGIRGHKTIQKLFSTIIFLYFACLLPAIAFGVLNDDNTNGGINVRKVVFAQAVGGIFFSVFGGQPMIVLLTTVPLAIYIKVIFRISESLNYDFYAMYACVGLSCQFFLILYACTELCSFMKLATRSAEEMFSLFIAIAFTVESIRAIHQSFVNNYNNCDDNYNANASATIHHNMTKASGINNHYIGNEDTVSFECHRDTSILYMLLMFGTLWLGMFLYNFRKTPYLTRSRREWLADYALPASVLIMSFLGAYGFSEIDKDMFKMRPEISIFTIPPIFSLPTEAYFICFLLGFFLSFLFYMDQNITSAIVNNSQNKLKKGSAQHLDMLVVALLNCVLSVGGLPWMHGALPHSPLHLRALADVEERVAQGHVHEVIMNVRETRLASLVAHLLILVSTFTLLPYPLRWIPTSVLHGLFLYMAFTSLAGNEMVERLLLLITEQQAYPPTHYIRRVPQRKVHLFTACQLIQLVFLCGVGFSPYPFVEMIFPIVCFCFLPIRHILVSNESTQCCYLIKQTFTSIIKHLQIPRLIDYKYLDALDGKH
ncbi:HCO3-cotransp domain-containing protein [Aphelenchoides besseyi]|nr:HCO3-cotransp domain-containing protein [Aphelenchoides besseyi]